MTRGSVSDIKNKTRIMDSRLPKVGTVFKVRDGYKYVISKIKDGGRAWSGVITYTYIDGNENWMYADEWEHYVKIGEIEVL